MLIVASKAKAYAKDTHHIRLSAEFLEALDNIVRGHIDDAVKYAQKDKRRTLKARDLHWTPPSAE